MDPFLGSGQTAIAAIKTNRFYVGYEINEEYIKLAEKRIREFALEFKSPDIFEFMDYEKVNAQNGT